MRRTAKRVAHGGRVDRASHGCSRQAQRAGMEAHLGTAVRKLCRQVVADAVTQDDEEEGRPRREMAQRLHDGREGAFFCEQLHHVRQHIGEVPASPPGGEGRGAVAVWGGRGEGGQQMGGEQAGGGGWPLFGEEVQEDVTKAKQELRDGLGRGCDVGQHASAIAEPAQQHQQERHKQDVVEMKLAHIVADMAIIEAKQPAVSKAHTKTICARARAH